MKTITGGCACGVIRYEVTAEPIVTFNCHCRDCQKTTGGATDSCKYVPGELGPASQKPDEKIRPTRRKPGRPSYPILSGIRNSVPRERATHPTAHRRRNRGSSPPPPPHPLRPSVSARKAHGELLVFSNRCCNQLDQVLKTVASGNRGESRQAITRPFTAW